MIFETIFDEKHSSIKTMSMMSRDDANCEFQSQSKLNMKVKCLKWIESKHQSPTVDGYFDIAVGNYDDDDPGSIHHLYYHINDHHPCCQKHLIDDLNQLDFESASLVRSECSSSSSPESESPAKSAESISALESSSSSSSLANLSSSQSVWQCCCALSSASSKFFSLYHRHHHHHPHQPHHHHQYQLSYSAVLQDDASTDAADSHPHSHHPNLDSHPHSSTVLFPSQRIRPDCHQSPPESSTTRLDCFVPSLAKSSAASISTHSALVPASSSSSSSIFIIKYTLLFTLFVFLNLFSGCSSVRVVRLNVPPRVQKGSNLELSCLFDLDNSTLYSLKWFYRAHEWDRDEQEFFRFTPRLKPYKQVFPLEGIQVDLKKSGGGTVFIRETNDKTSGKYKCEISVEENFQTVFAEKLMTVYNSSRKLFASHELLTLLIGWILVLVGNGGGFGLL